MAVRDATAAAAIPIAVAIAPSVPLGLAGASCYPVPAPKSSGVHLCGNKEYVELLFDLCSLVDKKAVFSPF